MKKVAFIRIMSVCSLLLIGCICFCQNELPVKDGLIFYEKIDSVNEKQFEIYNKAKLWFAESFKDSKEVIQVDDREAGMIVGKGVYMFEHSLTPYSCWFTVKVNIKESKYRIQFYDFSLEMGTSKYKKDLEKMNKKSGSDKLKEKINSRMLSLIDDFVLRQNKKGDNDF